MKGITRCLSCWLASGQNKRPQPNNPDATAVSAGDRLGHDEVTAWSAKAAWASSTLNNLTYTTLLGYWNPYIDAIGELEKAGDTRALALEPVARRWQIASRKL